MNDYDVYERVVLDHRGIIKVTPKAPLNTVEMQSIVHAINDAVTTVTTTAQYTNKANSILVITDSRDNNALFTHVEAFSALYKAHCDVNAYPLMLDMSLITSPQELYDTVTAIVGYVSGVELYNINETYCKMFMELYDVQQQQQQQAAFAVVNSTNKRNIDTILQSKATQLTSHAVYSALWRCTLDLESYVDMTNCLEFIVDQIESDYINLNAHRPFHEDFALLLHYISDYIIKHKQQRNTQLTSSKIITNYKLRYLYGNNVNNKHSIIKHYHTLNEKALALYEKHHGILHLELKTASIDAVFLSSLLSWENIDELSRKVQQKIININECSFKSNYGAMVTTSLNALPFIEGKCALLKHFAACDMLPLHISCNDSVMFTSIIQRISPTFNIITLQHVTPFTDCIDIEAQLHQMRISNCAIYDMNQHSLPIAVLAFIINTMKLRGNSPSNLKLVININDNTTQQCIALCTLLMKYGFVNVIVCDAHGTIYNKRKEHMNVYKEIIANTTNNNDTQSTTTKSAITNADIFINMCEYNKSEIYNALKTMNSRPIIITTYEHVDNVITETIDVEFGVYIAGCCTKGKANYIDSLLASTALISAVLFTNTDRLPIETKIAIAKAIALSIPDSKLSNCNITPKINEHDTMINIICKACEEIGKDKKIDIDFINDSLHCFYNEGYLLPTIPRK